jgi:hypothetical protein
MWDGTIRNVGALARAKSFPTFKPLGPAVLMAEDLVEQPDLLAADLRERRAE